MTISIGAFLGIPLTTISTTVPYDTYCTHIYATEKLQKNTCQTRTVPQPLFVSLLLTLDKTVKGLIIQILMQQ